MDRVGRLRSGVESWHDNIVATLIREGFEPSERNILLTKKRMMTESSDSPNAIQQVQELSTLPVYTATPATPAPGADGAGMGAGRDRPECPDRRG